MELRVYHAFRSPYSRLGLSKLKAAPLPANLKMRLFPFTGPAGGAAFLDPVSSPPKAAYYQEDVRRMTHRCGLVLSPPDPFDVDFRPAYCAAVAAELDGKGLAFACAVSDARWGEGKDVSDLAVLEACAAACGFPDRYAAAAQADPRVPEGLSEAAAMIEQDGVFGVPFAALVSGDKKDRFWGQDRFDLLLEQIVG